MNLSPLWYDVFTTEGIQAHHWSDLGEPDAPDTELLAYAKTHGYIVFTNDLDFGAILAATAVNAPSVLQIRSQALLPQDAKSVVLAALAQYADYLELGALVTVNHSGTRATLLPLVRDDIQ